MPGNDDSLRLEDLISGERLQKIQDNFSAAVGVAIIIVNDQGVPITRPSGFSAFCQAVRTSETRRDHCFHCDNEGGRRAQRTGEPSIYLCHCGLVDFAAPITVREQYLGAVLSGQVRLRADHDVSLDYISPKDDSWREDETLAALHAEADEIPYTKLRSAAYTMFHLADYLVEEGYANLVRQELDANTMKLMEESKRRTDLEKSLREAELKALYYQVNPHFLFNVLNTIGRLALMERAQKTENIVYAFADMMRYVLKKSRSQIVTLSSEVEHVRNYLFIQKVRMGDRFGFSMSVPSRYDNILCPFMLLHPIVENCVNYAVEPREADAWIEITARDDGRDLILDVTDNGDGIEPGLIRPILDGLAERQGRTGIGLHNVDSRLRHFFGDDYGLVIESPGTPGGGTSVRMRVPLEFDPYGI